MSIVSFSWLKKVIVGAQTPLAGVLGIDIVRCFYGSGGKVDERRWLVPGLETRNTFTPSFTIPQGFRRAKRELWEVT